MNTTTIFRVIFGRFKFHNQKRKSFKYLRVFCWLVPPSPLPLLVSLTYLKHLTLISHTWKHTFIDYKESSFQPTTKSGRKQLRQKKGEKNVLSLGDTVTVYLWRPWYYIIVNDISSVSDKKLKITGCLFNIDFIKMMCFSELCQFCRWPTCHLARKARNLDVNSVLLYIFLKISEKKKHNVYAMNTPV